MEAYESENSWVFDSLLCFLHGPVWNAPLQTFIEERSLIFDPNQDEDEDNEEYRKLHEEYKNLVDSMLGSFMDELHITPEQFEVACLQSKSNQSEGSFRFQQGLFKQIWAANDYRIFVRMMTQRNVELQLQALDLLERRQNSQSFDEETKEESQTEAQTLMKDNNDDELESALAQSIKSEVDHTKEFEEDGGGDKKFERLNLFFDKKKIDAVDIQARQEYLRLQRDRIVEIKKKARARQLNETVNKAGSALRPSSAQVAKQILEGHTENIGHSAERNEASIQLRRALAKRLRTEVVEQN